MEQRATEQLGVSERDALVDRLLAFADYLDAHPRRTPLNAREKWEHESAPMSGDQLRRVAELLETGECAS